MNEQVREKIKNIIKGVSEVSCESGIVDDEIIDSSIESIAALMPQPLDVDTVEGEILDATNNFIYGDLVDFRTRERLLFCLRVAAEAIAARFCAPVIDREKLADLCHNQWSGWMRYLFGKSVTQADGSVVIPADLAERWKRQVATSYAELSGPEQDSDRKEADKFIAVIDAASGAESCRECIERLVKRFDQPVRSAVPQERVCVWKTEDRIAHVIVSTDCGKAFSYPCARCELVDKFGPYCTCGGKIKIEGEV